MLHILVVPLPLQGHINPMFQFSKRLASKGLRVTLVTISSDTHHEPIETQLSLVKIESIYAASEEADKSNAENKMQWLQNILSERLPELISKQESIGYPISCIVYDSAMTWALDMAKGLGIAGASFFTHSCAVGTVYCNVHQGVLSVPLKEGPILLPGLPLLEPHDLPSFIYDPGSYPSFLKLVVGRFSNITDADWIFWNSFDCLEQEVVSWMRTRWPIKTIGPTLPSMYLDKRLEDDRDYDFNLFTPNVDTCIKWLESKDTGTVVYVSFGSMANLGEKQMEELALGLKRSKTNFLWVVRESEIQKLPSNFEEQTSEKGLVVNWCPQLQVLAHEAVGCFMTHCGWNSTLEALSSGVPMVAMPQWTDQLTNAKFVEDEWKVGVRVKVDQMGIVTKEEIERCIAQVMEGERGKEIKRNSMRWRELAKEAAAEGGSSDKNIEEFVAALLSQKTHPKSTHPWQTNTLKDVGQVGGPSGGATFSFESGAGQSPDGAAGLDLGGAAHLQLGVEALGLVEVVLDMEVVGLAIHMVPMAMEAIAITTTIRLCMDLSEVTSYISNNPDPMFGLRGTVAIASDASRRLLQSVSFHGVGARCLNIRAGVEIPDHKPLKFALQYIHGIGRARAAQILSELNMSNKLAMDLTRREVVALDDVLSKYVIGRDLAGLVDRDIKRMKDIQCYRGIRHVDNLPCRGQRTSTNARTRKGSQRVAVAASKKLKK
ncbi:unnamed protein product [Prunus armeniaca]|uniref:Uncharacterized protein n=1 Tax=Prunus armeniaca TaxID=36596 RepID=A0A6J5TUX3_PRUAR|nr:unnamed protein product [Prunus armeniaca]